MAKASTKKKYTHLTKTIQLPDGTRKYLRAKTQAELDEKVMKAQILVNAGVDICSEEIFGHFAQMWYDLYKKPYLRENSLNAIKYVLNQHTLPYIGGCRLRDVSPIQIQAIMASLSKKSNSLQSKVLIHLRSIFKAAQENGLVTKSPVSSMLKPGGRKTAEKTALAPQETRLLTERVKDPRAHTFLEERQTAYPVRLQEYVELGGAGAARDPCDGSHSPAHLRHPAVQGGAGHQGDPVSGGAQHRGHDPAGIHPLRPPFPGGADGGEGEGSDAGERVRQRMGPKICNNEARNGPKIS